MLFAILLSLAAGAALGWLLTKGTYVEKIAEIRDELMHWEGHAIADVRTLAARVKALL